MTKLHVMQVDSRRHLASEWAMAGTSQVCDHYPLLPLPSAGPPFVSLICNQRPCLYTRFGHAPLCRPDCARRPHSVASPWKSSRHLASSCSLPQCFAGMRCPSPPGLRLFIRFLNHVFFAPCISCARCSCKSHARLAFLVHCRSCRRT